MWYVMFQTFKQDLIESNYQKLVYSSALYMISWWQQSSVKNCST